ncbi:MAG: BatA domain-containing protein [Candidatus Eisenbacteria bacterium]
MNFLNPLFLAGLAAASLPILIHLFSKRKTKEMPFSSLEYLREISLKRVRRLQLRQFILLALRVLIVALFAAAMARPAIRGSNSPITRGSSTVAIVIDNSFSMASLAPERMGDVSSAVPAEPPADEATASAGSPAEGGTLYAQAKERAFEILDLDAGR